ELSSVQDVPASVGRASVTATLRAVPVPPLVTVIVNPIASPAETEALSATLAMSIVAQFTVMSAEASATPSLAVATVAELWTVPQVAEVVGEEMWTETDAPEARSPKLHVSTPKVIEQPATGGVMVQLVPGFVGRLSLTTTE